MSPESKTVICRCLISEIEAFERSLAERPPRPDHFGQPLLDSREDYLRWLRRALDEVRRAS